MNNPLFTSGQDWRSNACISRSHVPMRLYILGHKKAADLLAQQVVETAHDQDILVYPIAFLYRQYIELQLKEVIKESRILLSEGSGFPEHHKIHHLWDLASGLMRKIAEKIDPSVDDYIKSDDVDLIGTVIACFTDVDPESMAFRYPTSKFGKSSLGEITLINIRNLAERISSLSDGLDKFDLVVSVLRQQQDEMRQMFQP